MNANLPTQRSPFPTSQPSPVFLLAPARSYSTVCLALLAGHPDVFGFPELLLFTRETVREVLDETVFGALPHEVGMIKLSGLTRAVAQLNEGDQSYEALVRAYKWLRERDDWPAVRLIEHLFHAVSPRIPLEKSPETCGDTESLKRCVSTFDEARYIHLVRHPVTTQLSMRENSALRFDADRMSERERSLQCATSWYLGHTRIRKALAAIPAERVLTVRAEDILMSPAPMLRHIFEWLGLEASDATVERALQTERWCFAGTGAQGGLYGGDRKFMHAPRLRPISPPSEVRFPEEWQLPEPLCATMADLAHAFGYAREGMTTQEQREIVK